MNDDKLDDKSIEFNNLMHKFGRISSVVILLALMAVPFLIGIIFNVRINIRATLTAAVSVAAVFFPVMLIESLAYAPIIGPGGFYLALITGNIMIMKLPAAVSSINLTGYKQGSQEADVISIIAVGVSALVTMAILVIGLVLGTLMMPTLQSPVLAPAFANLMPAIIGAVAIPFFVINIKGSLVPYAAAAVVLYLMGRPSYTLYSSLLIPFFILLSIGWHYVLYKQSMKKKKE